MFVLPKWQYIKRVIAIDNKGDFMLLIYKILGYCSFLILIFVSIFLARVIRKRVYVQFYFTFSAFVSLFCTACIYLYHLNKLYSFVGLLLTYLSLFLPTIFIKLKLNFLNLIIRFIADIYREILLIGLPEEELKNRIEKEQKRIFPYMEELEENAIKKYEINKENNKIN